MQDHQEGQTEQGKLTPRSKRRLANWAKTQAWEELQQEASECIDHRLLAVSRKMDDQLRAHDTSEFWATWSKATEQGLIDYVSHQEKNNDPKDPTWKAFRG